MKNVLMSVAPPELEWEEDNTKPTTFRDILNARVAAAARFAPRHDTAISLKSGEGDVSRVDLSNVGQRDAA